MKTASIHLVLFLSLFLSATFGQSAPALITYAGKVNKDGQPFNGNGQFKFAFVNAAANDTYWSHDGTSTYGAAPTGYVTLPVNGGYYSILLGNTSISGMSAIDPAIFSAHSDVHLRVWFSDGVAAFEELAPHRPFASVPYALNAGISAGSITKSMLSSQVLADLNSSTPGPGTVTQQMLASELQVMLSGQSSSLFFAPTLSNPYGYAGGTPIESNASSYTVPSDKVLVILAGAGKSILIPYTGLRYTTGIEGPFIVPAGTSFQLQSDPAAFGWADANGFAGILFDPVPHLTPVLVSSGYQVPVGKVLVFGGSFDSAGSGEFSGISSTIHLAGSDVNGTGSGYLVDSSMLVNSGGSGGGTPAAGPSGLSSSVLAPTLANPYGFSGGTTIENNGSEYTVPGDKVLVIMSTGTDQPRVNVFGQNVYIRSISTVPSGTVIEEGQFELFGIPGWTGLLMGPQAHITPVFIPTGYQVPAGKVLVATSGTFTKDGNPIGVGDTPAIFTAGSTLTLSGTSIGIGYLIDASEF